MQNYTDTTIISHLEPLFDYNGEDFGESQLEAAAVNYTIPIQDLKPVQNKKTPPPSPVFKMDRSLPSSTAAFDIPEIEEYNSPAGIPISSDLAFTSIQENPVDSYNSYFHSPTTVSPVLVDSVSNTGAITTPTTGGVSVQALLRKNSMKKEPVRFVYIGQPPTESGLPSSSSSKTILTPPPPPPPPSIGFYSTAFDQNFWSFPVAYGSNCTSVSNCSNDISKKRPIQDISPDSPKISKKGRNCTVPSNKRGKKHSNITIEEELAKALQDPPTQSGVTPFYLQNNMENEFPCFVVINEELFYNYVLSSRPPEYKLDKASLLEKFDKSRPCNRVNPKEKYGRIPIKYLRIDNRKKNPDSVKRHLAEIKSQFPKQKIRIISHRDWNYLSTDEFIYEV
jgi:hypothetical protein